MLRYNSVMVMKKDSFDMLIRRGDVAAFPLYLSIPMANQCYVINVKLSMLRLTAQSRSTSNVIRIPEDLFKTKGSWLFLKVLTIFPKKYMHFKDLSFSH